MTLAQLKRKVLEKRMLLIWREENEVSEERVVHKVEKAKKNYKT